MKRKSISILEFVISCVFIITIISFVVGLYSDYKTGIKAAEKRFEKLSSQTTDAAELYPYNSREFITMFNNAVGSPDIYKNVSLVANKDEIYTYPSNATQSSSLFVKSFSTRITAADGADIVLSSGIYAVTPNMIYRRAKIAFIIILSGTLIAGILLIYLYLSDESPLEEEEAEIEKIKFSKSKKDNLDEPDFISEEELSTTVPYEEQNIQDDKQDNPIDQDQDIENSSTEQNQQKDYVNYYAMEKAYSEDAVQEDKPKEETTVTQDASTATQEEIATQDDSTVAQKETVIQSSPTSTQESNIKEDEQDKTLQQESSPKKQDNYKPTISIASGFYTEKSIPILLEEKLALSASTEKDLSLILIQIEKLSKSAPSYRDICKTLLEMFKEKENLFEYKNNGFAIINQDCDVNKAMEIAETLYTKIISISSLKGEKMRPTIGISSRSLRLIKSTRLINETEQALLHAKEDADSPIVAFRVNPSKYREYVHNS